jgi:signal transduction histidine kinase
MATGPSDRVAEEQAALRRVATLVARGGQPDEILSAISNEVQGLFGVQAAVLRFERYGPAIVFVGVSEGSEISIGTRWEFKPGMASAEVYRTGRPARVDAMDWASAAGRVATAARRLDIVSTVQCPIMVEGRLWGAMSVSSTDQLLPVDTEERLATFTELVGTAIANAQARVELRAFAEEQAALRRVATLVARAAPPEEVFAAVTAEVGQVLGADLTAMCRYDPDGAATVVGAWSAPDVEMASAVGARLERSGRSLHALVFLTGRPGRIEDHADASGAVNDPARERGFRSSVGAPISVEDRLWGVMTVASTDLGPLPADTELRLAGFTELVGTAIANAQARVELRGYAEEQAALRRVATLVARAAPPHEVFAAVTAEVGQVLSADLTTMSRYDPDGALTIVGAWTRTGEAVPFPAGTRLGHGGRNLHTLVFQTGRPVRIDKYDDATGPGADATIEQGIHSGVGAPISVEGRLWGYISLLSILEEPLPADTEARLAGFTELVGTAIANAEAQAALAASRARIVAAADTTRRRIERDLHDAAQQRLVSLALHLRSTVQAAVPPGADELTAHLDVVADEIVGVVDELRELARGLHPAALADGGLRPALKTLARRSAVPVRLDLDLDVDRRLPEPIELAAYYVVAEALANSVKHARASVIDVQAATGEGVLRVRVRDDGRGGADPTGGSGLIGLTDRVEALGGRLTLDSPPGAGTAMRVVLPLTAPSGLGSPATVTGRPDDTGPGG